jgi:spore coat polysaccharide biosynthesis protein SpsF
MTALILQARLDSTRLPGKALLLLGGKPLLLRVMEALNRVRADLRVLACPEDCAASFAPLAAEAGFELSPGPKDDVLARYGIAVRRFKVDRVIRAPGDNPFVFADAAGRIADERTETNADYAAYAGLPHGAGVEAINAEALLRAEKEARMPADREHVCPYLYNHPDVFTLHRPLAPACWQGPSLRVTVDTPEDLRRAERLYAALDRIRAGEAEDTRYRGESVLAACRELEASHPWAIAQARYE